MMFKSAGCRATYGRFCMRNDLERYVIEVNGIAKAEYPIFVKALKASLQLRQELPKCRIKLRDAGDETSH